ncbi:hypothetical protein C8R45DRAFT_1149405 [Mycena sanguinolenta]|nr:hypothetical protein C8R45DRAFT_1149405 [Mycena sanguinolenta]
MNFQLLTYTPRHPCHRGSGPRYVAGLENATPYPYPSYPTPHTPGQTPDPCSSLVGRALGVRTEDVVNIYAAKCAIVERVLALASLRACCRSTYRAACAYGLSDSCMTTLLRVRWILDLARLEDGVRVLHSFSGYHLNWQLIPRACTSTSTRIATVYDALGPAGLTHSLNEPPALSSSPTPPSSPPSSSSSRMRTLTLLSRTCPSRTSSRLILLFVGMPTGFSEVKTLTDASARNCDGNINAFLPSIMVGVPPSPRRYGRASSTGCKGQKSAREHFQGRGGEAQAPPSSAASRTPVALSVVLSSVWDATGDRRTPAYCLYMRLES